MPRPNRTIVALKARDYKATLWEMLLHEYRCAKSGDNVHKLGPNALASLIGALREVEEREASAPKDNAPNLIDLEEWVAKEVPKTKRG